MHASGQHARIRRLWLRSGDLGHLLHRLQQRHLPRMSSRLWSAQVTPRSLPRQQLALGFTLGVVHALRTDASFCAVRAMPTPLRHARTYSHPRSKLWGCAGELAEDPGSLGELRLLDWSYAGYMAGEAPIPRLPVVTNVMVRHHTSVPTAQAVCQVTSPVDP